MAKSEEQLNKEIIQKISAMFRLEKKAQDESLHSSDPKTTQEKEVTVDHYAGFNLRIALLATGHVSGNPDDHTYSRPDEWARDVVINRLRGEAEAEGVWTKSITAGFVTFKKYQQLLDAVNAVAKKYGLDPITVDESKEDLLAKKEHPLIKTHAPTTGHGH